MVCADFAHTTQHGAIQGKTLTKTAKYYNLDVIISVGYRVKSLRGTQFRQWAGKRLKDYLIQGYSVNQKRLEQTNQEIQILKSGIQILGRAMGEKAQEKGLEWLNQFTKGLTLLDDYDHERLASKGLSKGNVVYPNIESYQQLVNHMKSEFHSDVFGVEKDKGFESAIFQITKGFGNDDFISRH